MGVLPSRAGRDRHGCAVADTASPAAEGTLSGDRHAVADLRELLAQVGADAVRAGLVVGSGGNLSARSPGADECWVTASGSWLDRLGEPDFVRVRISDGSQIAPQPGGTAPSSEVALHLHAYRARPDVNAVVHLHPQSLLLLDALGEPIRFVTTDHAFYVRRVVRVGYHRPGSDALAVAAADAVAGGDNCVILAHHGCSVFGGTVELAHKRARNLEEAAQLTYRALLLGRGDIPSCPQAFLDDARPVI